MKSQYKRSHFYLCVTASFTIIVISFFNSSCKKLIDVNPPNNKLVRANIFASDATAESTLTAIYANLASEPFYASGTSAGLSSITPLAGLSADELKIMPGNASTIMQAYFSNQLKVINSSNAQATTYGNDIWISAYAYIYKVNAAIEGLMASKTLSPFVQQQLLGEAKFLRAFCYFYLVNLYGDLPLATGTDYTAIYKLPRSSKADIYAQILNDLIEAKRLLSAGYLASDRTTSSIERVYPTKWAASALLARVYIFLGRYSDAETESSSIINMSSLYSLNTLDGAFLKNSTEAVWQLQPVNTGWNTQEGRYFILTGEPTTNATQPYFLNEALIGAFEIGDQRKIKWINSITVPSGKYYYSYKYKKGNDASVTTVAGMTEYSMVLRLAEQYLIRAEARANQAGKLSGPNSAESDINIIRNRAGLASLTVSSQADAMVKIMQEKRVELFTEWGHRWLDIKRWGVVDSIMRVATPTKTGNNWITSQQLYPINKADIIRDPALTQNPGY